MHIQFAAGDLDVEILGRAGEGPDGTPPSFVARRDLARYYALLGDSLATLRLTETEAATVVAALRGWVVDPSSYRYAWSEVEDYLADQVEDAGAAELDDVPRLPAPQRAALVAKLRAASPGVQLAVCDAVERFWRRVRAAGEREALALPEDRPSAILREVGLVRD